MTFKKIYEKNFVNSKLLSCLKPVNQRLKNFMLIVTLKYTPIPFSTQDFYVPFLCVTSMSHFLKLLPSYLNYA